MRPTPLTAPSRVVLTKMNRILEIDEGNRLAVVQPGVVNLNFRTEVESRGLFYAPDPSSYDWCTIGGNLSTNAGGLCCVKYGVTTDAVLGLEVVLASGEVLRTGRRTVKGVAGYDLTRLIVGSEGTLGVITEATLALRPKPAAPCTLVAAFATTEAAGEAVSGAIRAGLVPSLLEIMDATCIRAVQAHTGSSILGDGETPAAILIGQSDAGAAVGRREMELLERGLRRTRRGLRATSPRTSPRAACCCRLAGPCCRRWRCWAPGSPTTSACRGPRSHS